MNERIKEFVVRAGIYDCEPNDPHLEVDEEYIKLAELIVRECIEQIHVADVGDLKGKAYYLDKVAEHIEEHFGVE